MCTFIFVFIVWHHRTNQSHEIYSSSILYWCSYRQNNSIQSSPQNALTFRIKRWSYGWDWKKQSSLETRRKNRVHWVQNFWIRLDLFSVFQCRTWTALLIPATKFSFYLNLIVASQIQISFSLLTTVQRS